MKLENEKCSNCFLCAVRGIIDALRTEKNLRFDFFIALCVIALGLAFKIGPVEWMVCLISMGIMLSAELFNTAIEYFVDMYTREKNEMAGKIKDISAGAVFLLSINVAVVGFIIFIPKIYKIIFG